MESGMTPILLSLALLQAVPLAPPPPAPAPLPDSNAPPPSDDICDEPVLMVVSGPTHDRARMMAYGQAIARSQLYQQLGGYYVNLPRAVATFEGTPPEGFTTLIVRFPCLANAQAFWNSRVYQRAPIPSLSIPKRRCARIWSARSATMATARPLTPARCRKLRRARVRLSYTVPAML
jgi:uncharacterized protein (DUF1330 family)